MSGQDFGFFKLLWLVASTQPYGPIVCACALVMVLSAIALNCIGDRP